MVHLEIESLRPISRSNYCLSMLLHLLSSNSPDNSTLNHRLSSIAGTKLPNEKRFNKQNHAGNGYKDRV